MVFTSKFYSQNKPTEKQEIQQIGLDGISFGWKSNQGNQGYSGNQKNEKCRK